MGRTFGNGMGACGRAPRDGAAPPPGAGARELRGAGEEAGDDHDADLQIVNVVDLLAAHFEHGLTDGFVEDLLDLERVARVA